MNPQILGNLTSLAQKVQQANLAAIKAQQMALNASNTTSAGSAASGAPTFITPISQASGSGSASWTTTTIVGIPFTTTVVKCEFVINEGNAASGQIRVRKTGTTNDFAAIGMTTANNVGGYSATCADVPVNNLQFDYEVTGPDSWAIRVIAYW